MDTQVNSAAKSATRRRGQGGPINSLALPAGIFLLFVALAMATALEEQHTAAIITAVVGFLFIGYSMATSYKWFEQTFFHRRFALGLNNLVLIGAVAGILGMLNFLAYRHNAQFDFTKERKFSLSDQTLKLLGNLKDPIQVWAFFIEGSPDDARGQRASQEKTMVKNLLERYALASPKFTFKMIDPEKEPTITKQYNITYNGTTVLKCKERDVRIEPDKMFEYSRALFNPRLQNFNGEQAITSAILDLTSGTVRTVTLLEGHGERSTDSEDRQGLSVVKEYLLRDQYKLEKLNLLAKPEVPAQTSLLVIAAPKKNYDPKEIELVEKWMSGGKPILFLVDSDLPATLRGLLKKYGIEAAHNLVIDPAKYLNPLFGGTPIMLMPDFGSHPVIQPLQEKKRAVVIPWATMLKENAAAAQVKGLTYHELLKSGPESWAEVDMDQPQAKYDVGRDTKGPCVLAYAFGKEEAAPPANPMEQKPPAEPKVTNRAVVFGSIEFASNAWAEKGGNIDLFMNAVNWLTGESERISIRPKSEEAPKLEMEVAQYANRILYVTMLLIPGFILGLGVYVWWRRSSL